MFVVFEGIDGSGKTTISNLVAEGLRARDLTVTHVREKGKFASRVSEAIRELGRDAKNLELLPHAEFLLYVARDVQLIEQTLRPALAKSDVVLADRFLSTPEVLGCHGRHLSPAWTAPMLEAAANGLHPDLVILVNVDPALARARRKSAKLAASDTRPPARKGLSGAGLQHRLRQGYLACAARAPDRWAVVDNTDVLEDAVNRIIGLITEARATSVEAALTNFRRTAGAPSSAPPRAPPVTERRPARAAATPDGALQAFVAWIDDRAVREPRVAAYFLGGLCGRGIDQRRRALAQRVPQAVLLALAGLDDEVSWELRDALQADLPAWVARSLVGMAAPHGRAHAVRRALATEVPSAVAESLEAIDDDEAWALRERLFAKAAEAVVGSLATLASDRAWAVRQRWLAEHGGAIEQDHDAARIAAQTVIGLDDERAWALRARALAAAPVAALASLEGVTSERAWELRASYLHHAPKVIMGTLSAVADPRAWNMRHAVVADCKEAIDSMADMDSPPAWALREAHADRWVSTVVKSLGPLAYGERGQALIARQLRAYPDNLSLLKHAAAVALGARSPVPARATEVLR